MRLTAGAIVIVKLCFRRLANPSTNKIVRAPGFEPASSLRSFT